MRSARDVTIRSKIKIKIKIDTHRSRMHLVELYMLAFDARRVREMPLIHSSCDAILCYAEILYFALVDT
jgi:hypothetical protein